MVNTSQSPVGKVGTGVGDGMWNKIKGNTRVNFELCTYKTCLELLCGTELRQVSSVPWHFSWMVRAHRVCTVFYTPLLPKFLPSAPESPHQYRVQMALIRVLSLIQFLELPKSHLERSENPPSSQWMAMAVRGGPHPWQWEGHADDSRHRVSIEPFSWAPSQWSVTTTHLWPGSASTSQGDFLVILVLALSTHPIILLSCSCDWLMSTAHYIL